MDGFINILKPPGLTSNQVVMKVRKIVGQKKIGHSGTLDPGAAGVLVLGVNKGTRLLEHLLGATKCYRAEITFGLKTSTGDSFGEIIEKKENTKVTKKDLEEAISSFIGQHWQTPPMTSAIKMQGKKLYQLAREGKIVERKSRLIEIKGIKLNTLYINKGLTKAIFDVQCSKGTYIRTLCEDIAKALNTVGYMSFLIRTQVGLFNIYSAYSLQEIMEKCDIGNYDFLYPLEYVIDNESFVKYTLNEDELFKAYNGVAIETEVINNDKLIALFSSNDKLVALGRYEDNKIKLNKVFK